MARLKWKGGQETLHGNLPTETPAPGPRVTWGEGQSSCSERLPSRSEAGAAPPGPLHSSTQDTPAPLQRTWGRKGHKPRAVCAHDPFTGCGTSLTEEEPRAFHLGFTGDRQLSQKPHQLFPRRSCQVS